MIVAVDGGSSHMSGYFLPRKDAATTLAAFMSYHIKSKCQTGKKLKLVWVDAGQEWVNELWAAYLGNHGIVLKITTPYAHAQNGLAERANHMILEGMCYMLAESGLPKESWAEVAATQIYTRNLLPSAWHPGTIPNEAWTGRRQCMDHLQPWGCLAWAKIPEELVRSKLDPRLVKTRLVGYTNGGYRLYDQRSRSVVTSRDVIFDEGVGHRSLTVINDSEEVPPALPTAPAPSTPQPGQVIAPL